MSTDYYLEQQPACATCGRAFERLHIGMSAAGWVFALHVIPDRGIHDLPDWETHWAWPFARIVDEYDRVIEPAEMRRIVTGGDELLHHLSSGGVRVVRSTLGNWDLLDGEFS